MTRSENLKPKNNDVEILSIGMLVTDIVITLKKLPNPGEMNYVSKEEHGKIHSRKLGGHAGIFSTDMAKLGIKPSKIGIIGSVGKDENGRFLKGCLKELDIRAYLQEKKTDTSENIIIAVKDEDKRYDLYPGANLELEKNFVLETIKNTNPEIVHCCAGYTGIDSHLESIFKKIKEKHNSQIILDIVDPYKKPNDFFMPALEHVDILKANEQEVRNATNKKNTQDGTKILLNKGVKSLFLTREWKGAEYITPNLKIVQPTFEVNSVDQTGCGDAFTAGIAYKLLEKEKEREKRLSNIEPEELVKILEFGQAAGAIASTKAGATTAMEKDKINKLIREQGNEIRKNTKIKQK